MHTIVDYWFLTIRKVSPDWRKCVNIRNLYKQVYNFFSLVQNVLFVKCVKEKTTCFEQLTVLKEYHVTELQVLVGSIDPPALSLIMTNTSWWRTYRSQKRPNANEGQVMSDEHRVIIAAGNSTVWEIIEFQKDTRQLEWMKTCLNHLYERTMHVVLGSECKILHSDRI